MTATPDRHRDTYDPGPDENEHLPRLTPSELAAEVETDKAWRPLCEVRGCFSDAMDGHFCGWHGPQW